MKKVLKIFSLMLVILPVMLIFVACGSKEKSHTHNFSEINTNFCVRCDSYVVKGEGSKYLEEGEQAQILEEVVKTATPVDDILNIIISGAVDHENLTTSYVDISQGAKVVNIIGEDNNASITLTGGIRSLFLARDAILNVENVIVNCERDLAGVSGWEVNNMPFKSSEVNFKNCKFTKGVVTRDQTKVSFDNCEFNTSDNLYAIWLGAKGFSGYSSYDDNVKEVVIKNCTFNSLRGIKVLTNGATVTIENNTFNNLTSKPGIVLDSNCGEMNYVTIKNNTFKNCTYGKYNTADNTIYENGEEAYLTEYFTVTESGSKVK